MKEAPTPQASHRRQIHSAGHPDSSQNVFRGANGNSQEGMDFTQSQSELMTQNELTQLGDFEDGVLSPQLPHSPVNPASLPWGRLIPCSQHWLAQDGNKGIENRRRDFGGIDLLPKCPASSLPGKEATVSFLGLDNLKPSDTFNEYILGRSGVCDIVAVKPPLTENAENDAAMQDWAHAMISNRHCRIYCMLKITSSNGISNTVDMDVYVEDSSGNGTMINNTTILRRGERRILHTGDEISLVNPTSLRKKIRSHEMLSDLQRHHSFIFVNVYHQQGHQHSLLTSMRQRQNRYGLMPPPSSAKRKGIVDVRAMNNHSLGKPSAQPRPSPLSAVDAVTPTSQGRRVSPRRQQQRRIEEEYDMRDLLGSGTCGEVRRAIHRRSGEERAVKVIALGGRNRSSSRSAEADAAFEAEASILQTLDHPYVVKLVDVFVSPGVAVYLVMELVHGGDLFDRIVQKGKYTELESRRVMRRLLNSVHYLHETKNIVHRDLKPENILCISRQSDIDVKLTDFGLAKSITEDGLKTFCGTPQYFAPEVLRRRHTVAGRGRYGKQADMWSLGVILYILLSGTPPFDVTQGIDVVAEAKISFPDRNWIHVSEEARDLVTKLLMADPRKRISAKDACTHKWILTEDGDTHTHPLDDPATRCSVIHLTTDSGETELSKKRLFLDEEEASPLCQGKRTIIRATQSSQIESENMGNAVTTLFETPKPVLTQYLSLNARSNNFRAHVVRSADKATPTSGDEHNVNAQFKRSGHNVVNHVCTSQERRSPDGVVITPKSWEVISSLPEGQAITKLSQNNQSTNETKASDETRHAKVVPAATKVVELTDDEICSQFSDDERDSISSFSGCADEIRRELLSSGKSKSKNGVQDVNRNRKATRRRTMITKPAKRVRKNDPSTTTPPRKKRRMETGKSKVAARLITSARPITSVSDEDVSVNPIIPPTSSREVPEQVEALVSNDSKVIPSTKGRQTTLSTWFTKKDN